MNHVPDVQMSPHLTALRCLYLIALHHGVQIRPEKLGEASEADTLGSVLRIMRDVGLAGKHLKGRDWDDLANLGSAYPVMAELNGGSWVIVASAMTTQDGRVVAAVLNPNSEQTGVALIPREQFEEMWSGRLVLSKRKYSVTDETQPFGLRWFMPEIIKNGRYFRDIAIAATMSNLISFATPLFFQIIVRRQII